MKYLVLRSDLNNIQFTDTYQHLKDALTESIADIDHSKIINMLGRVSEHARVAGYILAIAKNELRKAENEFDVKYAEWHYEGYKYLDSAISEGIYTSAISKETIRGWVMKKYKKEYTELIANINEMRLVVDALSYFYDQWDKRQTNLQSQTKLIKVR